MSSSTFVTTEDGGRQNMYAMEPPTRLVDNYTNYSEEAEKLNGRLAMIGFVAAIGAYSITGQLIPGIF